MRSAFSLSTRCVHVEDAFREFLRVYDLHHFRYQNGHEFREDCSPLLASTATFPSSPVVFPFRSRYYSFGHSLRGIPGADGSVKDEGNDGGNCRDVLLSHSARVGCHPRGPGLRVIPPSCVVRRQFRVGTAAFRDEQSPGRVHQPRHDITPLQQQRSQLQARHRVSPHRAVDDHRASHGDRIRTHDALSVTPSARNSSFRRSLASPRSTRPR